MLRLRLSAVIPWLCVLVLMQLSPAVARADLLVTNNKSGEGNILRYDDARGAFISPFVPNAGFQPLDMTFAPDGNLYVTNGVAMSTDPSEPRAFSVRRYNGSTGSLIDVFAIGGLLHFPQGLAFGSDGNLYVGNQGNAFQGINGVLRYDGKTGSFLDIFASTGSLTLFPSLGLAFGPDGNLYLASENNVSGLGEVVRYDAKSGAFLDIFASGGGLGSAKDLLFGPDGNLYVSTIQTNNPQSISGVIRYDGQSGAFIDVFVRGSGGFQGLAFGPDGNLYVASNGPNQVSRYDGTTGAFIDAFITPGRGGLEAPISLLFFTPEQAVPEPSTLLLLGTGLAFGAAWKRVRRRSGADQHIACSLRDRFF